MLAEGACSGMASAHVPANNIATEILNLRIGLCRSLDGDVGH